MLFSVCGSIQVWRRKVFRFWTLRTFTPPSNFGQCTRPGWPRTDVEVLGGSNLSGDAELRVELAGQQPLPAPLEDLLSLRRSSFVSSGVRQSCLLMGCELCESLGGSSLISRSSIRTQPWKSPAIRFSGHSAWMYCIMIMYVGG